VLDDSVEAADHLLRVPGALLLVDGYNVAKAAWPDLSAAQQRARLVDALEAAAARTGARPVVVFDGADVSVVPAGAPRRLVQVRFSPADVEADDVVLEAVAAAPDAVPVVVVSSDRRVRDGARELGANLVSSAQLRAAIGI
jgi:predicted RNA-binding protein with PIN domain